MSSAEVDTPNGPDQIGNTTTANDGSYLIEGLPATTVKVHFQDCNFAGPYLDQWWNDQPDPSTANSVTLAAGTHTTGIDAHLAAAAAITGTVTDAADNPLPGICAQATTSSFFGGLARSDTQRPLHDHPHKTSRLPSAVRGLQQTPRTSPGNGGTTNPAPPPPTLVSVAPGQVVTGIDAHLAPGAVGTISGKVVNLHGARDDHRVRRRVPPQPVRPLRPRQPRRHLHRRRRSVRDLRPRLPRLPQRRRPEPRPSPTPDRPTTYQALWWNAVPLSLGQNPTRADPTRSPKAPTSSRSHPRQHLTGYDCCFGCTAITITSITPGNASLTIAFTTPGLANPANASDVAAAASLDPHLHRHLHLKQRRNHRLRHRINLTDHRHRAHPRRHLHLHRHRIRRPHHRRRIDRLRSRRRPGEHLRHRRPPRLTRRRTPKDRHQLPHHPRPNRPHPARPRHRTHGRSPPPPTQTIQPLATRHRPVPDPGQRHQPDQARNRGEGFRHLPPRQDAASAARARLQRR